MTSTTDRLMMRLVGSRSHSTSESEEERISEDSKSKRRRESISKLRSRFSTLGSQPFVGSATTTAQKDNATERTTSLGKSSKPVYIDPSSLLTTSKHKPLPKTPPKTPEARTPKQADFTKHKEDKEKGEEKSEDDMQDIGTRPMLNRQNTMDTANGNEIYGRQRKESESPYIGGSANGFQNEEGTNEQGASNVPLSAGPGTTASPAQNGGGAAPTSSSTHLSGLMCNVHRTTGREPHALVGATTTILGDKLYVFGGKILSRTRAALTADLYELDLIKRHWTKLDTKGSIPPPRYFHSMCPLGDTKLVCYGGMSPSTSTQGQAMSPGGQNAEGQDSQPEVVVMSDIHIYDAPTNTWHFVRTTEDTPQGRYAHCATIMPSWATFKNTKTAPLSALQHNPSSENPNEGSIGIDIDGTGGAEMVVVGGQDSANHYIEQISIFNLRSLRWTRTEQLGKMCGAYRSVIAPVSGDVASMIGRGGARPDESSDAASSMLIYSNYNFLDVKLELQIRTADGTLTEKPMNGSFTPPGLRFPNGGVIDTNFVVSGTYLTSSKQEYALWALDLKTLTWSRIDAGGNVFSQGSWNRGVLWNRRNTFVILGNRKRSLVEDYNHRRLNFSNVCMVELEAFGLYDNPRKTTPMSGFVSASSPAPTLPLPALPTGNKLSPWNAGGRTLNSKAAELGSLALASKELADMDILAVGGERIPVNSRIVARRWGPYFIQILREGAAAQDGTDTATLRSGAGSLGSGSTFLSARESRMSSITITNTNLSSGSGGASSIGGNPLSPASLDLLTPGSDGTTPGATPQPAAPSAATITQPPSTATLPPTSRPRTLYLPHTHLTIQSLLHFLYTSSLPTSSSPLCTPQILCSLLQLARPYRIDGLVEAVVERLHRVLDSRNAAAVFNASAMAAGGGRGLVEGSELSSTLAQFTLGGGPDGDRERRGTNQSTSTNDGLRITTSFSHGTSGQYGRDRAMESESEDGGSAVSEVSASSMWDDTGDEAAEREASQGRTRRRRREREVWRGEVSSVIGLQKRGLRGLMEGRRLRERGQGASGQREVREGGRERAPTLNSQSGSLGSGQVGVTAM